ncbi:hypothetical protein Tco_1084980, partial [Tanacetum coccineum]
AIIKSDAPLVVVGGGCDDDDDGDLLMRIIFGVRRKNPPENFSGGGSGGQRWWELAGEDEGGRECIMLDFFATGSALSFVHVSILSFSGQIIIMFLVRINIFARFEKWLRFHIEKLLLLFLYRGFTEYGGKMKNVVIRFRYRSY